MREWSLEWIEIGEPVRYGPFTIDRYVADVGQVVNHRLEAVECIQATISSLDRMQNRH
jgi:hypothetical protein